MARHCVRFKKVHGTRKCAKFAGGGGSRRRRTRRLGEFGGLGSLEELKGDLMRCVRYSRDKRGVVKCFQMAKSIGGRTTPFWRARAAAGTKSKYVYNTTYARSRPKYHNRKKTTVGNKRRVRLYLPKRKAA